VSVAGVLHVSHLSIFTSTELGTYMKVARLPHGPTLTFQVHNYSLTRDVVSAMKKQFVFEKLYQNAPLVVLNSFSGEGLHMKLMASMFQNMFPTINVTKVRNMNLRKDINSYNKTKKMHKFLKFIFGVELYVFRAGLLSIIRSLVLYDIYLLLRIQY